jgi:predicted pyridoxine 5'-phosphate oxidase superfamily flavin-nucleotide-binding protein
VSTGRTPSLRIPRGWERVESPFHEGEQRVQTRLGVRDRVERMGRNGMRDFMPDEHRELFEDLPFVVVGSVDGDAEQGGALWSSLLLGEPGFVQAPTPRSLVIRAESLPGDPLACNLLVGAPLGLLGIELSTRRRNRANGRIARVTDGVFELSIEQSFGNCKQYIQSRVGLFASAARRLPATPESAVLTIRARQVLARADTAFIATSSRRPRRGGAEGVDVSHRGGRAGFIRTDERDGATWLTLPDFSGNFMFNSFGNLEVNPRAGMLALDFETGALLSVTGTARVIWDGPLVEAFQGAERLLEFRVAAGRLWEGVLTGWSDAEPSPHLRGTGTWDE